MKKFPSEILVAITDHLTFADKLELAYVCKNWYQLLSQTTLYKELTFRKQEYFNQAILVSDKKQLIRQCVRKLGIFELDYDMELAWNLPALFPNLTSLEWKSLTSHKYDILEERYRPIFAQALQQWNNMECLVDCTYCLNIATGLIQVTRCDKLTRLQVSLATSNQGDYRVNRRLLQVLIRNIHKAPSLEHVSFSDTTIRLTDLEDLHTNFPLLKNLGLEQVRFYLNDNISDMNHIFSKALQSLVLNIVKWHSYEEMTYTIGNWIKKLHWNLCKLQWRI